jgi:hypothetical protein
MIMGVQKISKYDKDSDLSEALSSNLQKTLLAGNFDLKTVKSQIKKLFSVEMTKYESEKKKELFYDNILKDVKFKPLTAFKHFNKQYLHIPRKINQTIICSDSLAVFHKLNQEVFVLKR